MLYGASNFSWCFAVTQGLLELMSTGELISKVCLPVGEWTILLRVLRAVVIENCLMVFLLDSDPLQKVGDSTPFDLGKNLCKGEGHFRGEDW